MTKKKKICIAVVAAVIVAAAATATVFFVNTKGITNEAANETAETAPVLDSYEMALEKAKNVDYPNVDDYKNVEDYMKALTAARIKRLDRLKIFFDSLKTDYIKNTDFEQDISSFSINDLLLKRNGIYAVNGLYFKDDNLNSYFLNKKNATVPWYSDYMCFLLEYEFEKKDGNVETYSVPEEFSSREHIIGVLAEKEKDIKLSDTEKLFVERLDKRIAELQKNDMYISKDGYTVGNAAHIINMHKVKNFEKNYMDKIAQNNFVIVAENHNQLFHVYENNNYAKMPSFVTTDLFLQAFHMYLSYALKKLEQEKFISALEDLSFGIYKASMNLTESEDAEIAQIAKYNAAFYAIAYTLLTGKTLSVPEEHKDNYDTEVKFASEASTDGVPSVFLASLAQGEPMFMQYSLFKPRGHYTRKPEMEAFFKSMMWLQKAFSCRDRDMHLKQGIFTANLLNTAKSAKDKLLIDIYASIFEPTAHLVGEPNNLSVMDIAQFLKNENIEDMSAAFSAENVEKVDKKLISLAGRILIKPKLLLTCPDKINFMPQRYLIDNEVLQDLVDTSFNAKRAFSKGLDVFSAFGSAPASDLLNNFYKEKDNWKKYPEEMAKLQKKFKNFDGWNKSVYNKWIESLLTLQKTDKSYPVFMNTKAWDYKNLNTSLASWAELKHDFILYADQPMAAEGGGACSPTPYFLPEADVEVGYVEPNILFWKKLNELVKLTGDVLAKHKLLDGELKKKNTEMQSFITFLIGVSEKELAKKTLTSKEYERIRNIGAEVEHFTLEVLDTEENVPEWSQVKGPDRSVAVVADVYTRNMPADPKNGILHVATGNVNEIYVVVEINGYLYLTKGATFSYYEFVTPEGVRLTDEEWQERLENKSERPEIPEWMQTIVIDNESKPEAFGDVHPIYCFERGCEDEAFDY